MEIRPLMKSPMTLPLGHGQKTREKYNVTEEVLREGDTTPSDFIKRRIHEAFRERIENEGMNKSKILYLLEGNQEWNPGQPKPYMLQLGR